MATKFRDRFEAGRILASALQTYANRPDAVILALPRGGVPVAYEVSRHLHIPMDVFLVRKIGVPAQPELAMGAIASGGVRVVNRSVVEGMEIDQATFDAVAAREQGELDRRERLYRDDRPPIDLAGKTVILVDDGLATGTTMRAAAAAVRHHAPATVIVAVPVAAAETVDDMRNEVDAVICPMIPPSFYAVGLWYEDFSQTTDRDVRDLLERAQAEHLVPGAP